MGYKVKTTRQARQDIDNITDYIIDKFNAPQAAYKKYTLISAGVDDLVDHPHWHHAYVDNPWQKWDLYVYNVDNYKIIHVPDDENQKTTVIRVFHDMQDLPRQLRSTDTSELEKD